MRRHTRSVTFENSLKFYKARVEESTSPAEPFDKYDREQRYVSVAEDWLDKHDGRQVSCEEWARFGLI